MSDEKGRYTCAKCGSDKVQLAMWVNPNTHEVFERVFDHVVSGVTSTWCDDCEDEVEVLDARAVSQPCDQVSK